jgi:outer membrane protein TolC
MLGRRPRLTMLKWLLFVVFSSISGCATYAPKPLAVAPDLAHRLAGLTIDIDKLIRPTPGLRPHTLDFDDGLDMTETVMLAVLNNPGLKAVRARRHLAQAQLFAAGLLPDPQLNLSFDHPTSGPPPLTNAYSFGLSEDLQALITRGAVQAAQIQTARQVDLEILWQEWQVTQQARVLVVRSLAEMQLLDLSTATRNLLAERYARESKALQQGDVTLDKAAGDLVGLVDADTRLRDLEREANQTRYDLLGLLGLAPNVKLVFKKSPGSQTFSDAELKAALTELPRRRPDLVALQAGYRSQEQLVRRAILAQFPALNVGFNQARDTGDVDSVGFGINIGLPLFNRNRGEIAAQRATRVQLHAEYQARIDRAFIEAHRAWTNARLLSRQLRAARARLPDLAAMTAKAQAGFDAGNLDPLIYITLETNWLAKRSEVIRLEQSLREAQIGLETLLGMTLKPG